MFMCYQFRNLSAIDYLATHTGITVAEFKAVWDNIDGETRQVRHCYYFLFQIDCDRSLFNLAVRRPQQIEESRHGSRKC